MRNLGRLARPVLSGCCFLAVTALTIHAQPLTFTTFAGPAGGAGSDDGTGSVAHFNRPAGVATDSGGNVYVADTDNHTIRKITASGVVRTLAGLAGVSGSADGAGSAARFNSPGGVAADSAGNIYVADSGNKTIRKITAAGVVSTLAGSALNAGIADGTGGAARFDNPLGVATDSAGNVYVADANNDTIRKITPAAVVTTLAGSPGLDGSTDGTGSAARFSFPYGVATDGAGNVYVADYSNSTIRKITPAGAVTTFAGAAHLEGITDGTGSAARFRSPDGVATDHGKQGTRDAFRAMVAAYRVTLSVKTDEVTVCGAIAYDLGSVRLILTPKAGGEPRMIDKRFLEVWRKDKSGWRVTRVMNNAVPK